MCCEAQCAGLINVYRRNRWQVRHSEEESSVLYYVQRGT